MSIRRHQAFALAPVAQDKLRSGRMKAPALSSFFSRFAKAAFVLQGVRPAYGAGVAQ